MPFGALFFFLGSGIAISECLASLREREKEAFENCGRRLDLSEQEVAIYSFIAIGVDDYEALADQNVRCLVDCVFHEVGLLDATDKFTVSEFIENELKEPSVNETEQKIKLDHYKVMTDCVETVENWDGWNRTAKCQKGYVFFKCKSFGPDAFKLYMDFQRKLASELMLMESGSSSRPTDSTTEDSNFEVTVETTEENNSTEMSSSQEPSVSTPEDSNFEVTVGTTEENNSTEMSSSQEPSVSTEGLSERVTGISLNEEIPPSTQLNTPNKT